MKASVPSSSGGTVNRTGLELRLALEMEVSQDGQDFELRGATHPRPRHNTKPASDDTTGLEEFSSFYREERDEVVFAGGRPRERPREALEPHGSTRWVWCCVL